MTTRFCLFSDYESYSFGDIKQILDATMQDSTLRKWLCCHGIRGCKMPGRGTAYSGRQLNQAIEAGDKWESDDEP